MTLKAVAATSGVGARRGGDRTGSLASYPGTKKHNALRKTSRTIVPEFSDDGALIGWSLFSSQIEARTFLRAGGAR